MTDRERLRAFIKERNAQLRQLTAAQRAAAGDVVALLKRAQEVIRRELALMPSDYKDWSLQRLQQSIAAELAQLSQDLGQAAAGAQSSAWGLGVDLVDAPLEAAGLRLVGQLGQVDTRQLLAMRTFMTDRMSDVSADLARRINNQLGLVMIGTQTPAEAVATISGAIDGGRGRALTILRTEVGRAYSTAAHERKVAAKPHLPGLKKQWRRSGKIHSRRSHDLADGQVQDIDQPFIVDGVEIMYPRAPGVPAKHSINCGCLSLPIMESWEVTTPGRKPYSEDEIRLDRFKRDLDYALNG